MRRLFPLILFAFVVVITFAILEVGSYAYLRIYRGYDGQHLMNYQFDPYKNIRLTKNFVDTRGVRHNAQGFRRSEDTPRVKPKGTYRIFLMGGSTGYGLRSLSQYGASKYPVIRNDETIDFYLERYLDEKIPDARVEVINAAITSFYSHHHLIYLNQTILKFDPDMIIFLDGFNDYYMYKQADFDQFRDYAYQERVHTFMNEPSLNAWLRYTGWWLFRKSHFAHLGGRAARNVVDRINFGGGGQRRHIDVENALENLRRNAEGNFVKMVERNGLILDHEGVSAIFALQPEVNFDQSKQYSPLEELIYQEMVDYWPENYIEYKNRARVIVREYLQESTGKTGSTFIDLTDPFAGVEGDAYTDYCHLSPIGNRALAEYLGDRVVSMIRREINTQASAAELAGDREFESR